jgi:UPF0755 protein
MRRMRRGLMVISACALAAVAIAGFWVGGFLSTPLNIDGDEYILDVAKGSTLRSVTNTLATDDVLLYPRLLSLLGRLSGKAEKIQAGEYRLTSEISTGELLNLLVDGRVRLHSLTIIEGWTVADLLEAIERHPALTKTLVIKAPMDLIESIDMEYDHPEGLFFPETYRFPRGTTDRELLQNAHDLMRENLANAWAERQPGIILKDPYEALILASIVERESALDSERPEIAGVFVRRLQKNMRLQTDPTVIYGLGASFDGNLTRRHLAEDNPYNTYVRKGLPPTPIALPGNSALRAAVNPAPGDSLYFVATGKNDGSHYFTATLEEHNKAVARYLAYMRQERRK